MAHILSWEGRSSECCCFSLTNETTIITADTWDASEVRATTFNTLWVLVPDPSRRLPLKGFHQPADMRFDHHLIQRQRHDLFWNHSHWR